MTPEKLAGFVLFLVLVVIGVIEIVGTAVRFAHPMPTAGVFALALAYLIWRSGLR